MGIESQEQHNYLITVVVQFPFIFSPPFYFIYFSFTSSHSAFHDVIVTNSTHSPSSPWETLYFFVPFGHFAKRTSVMDTWDQILPFFLSPTLALETFHLFRNKHFKFIEIKLADWESVLGRLLTSSSPPPLCWYQFRNVALSENVLGFISPITTECHN